MKTMKRRNYSAYIARKRLIAVLLSLFAFLAGHAQISVSGIVTDITGEGISSVNVLLENTRQGVTTNSAGQYKIVVPQANAVLEFSHLGYKTQRVPLNGRTVVDVTLADTTSQLDEVIVVGYGKQRRITVTGSIAQINSDEILRAPVGNISNALAGRLPGLVAVQRSGQPGSEGSTLLVRGTSTLGDNTPIVIVDGVQRSFGNIDPNEVESITVLKDASAAAVYGVQGAAGVILVTTKRGKNQAPKVTYSGRVAYNQNTNFPRFLDGPDYVKYYNQARELDGLDPIYTEDLYNKLVSGDPEGKIANTNWLDAVMKKGSYSTNHNVSVNGGANNVRYFLSLGYLQQNGIIKNVNFQRYNLRSNIDVDLKKGFKLGFDLSARQEDRRYPYASPAAGEWNNPILQATRLLPITPMYYDGLPTSPNLNYVGINPVASIDHGGYNNSILNVLLASVTLQWDLPWVEGLNLKMVTSYDKDYNNGKIWKQPFDVNYYNVYDGSYSRIPALIGEPNTEVLQKGASQSQRLTLQPSINYARRFGKHDISGLLLYEQSNYESDRIFVGVQDFDLTTLHELQFGKNIYNNQKTNAIQGTSYTFPRAGFVGRINYSYDNRYLAEIAARYDGSSRFPTEKRWGFFPAVSAGWRVSEEDFFERYRSVVDNLKIRASAGLLGNDRIAEFQYLNLIAPNPPTVYFGSNEYISIYSVGNVNRDITWEKTGTYNIGFELMLKRGIFGMELDYFYKITNDILMGSGTYPPSLGGNYPRTINGGIVDNKGFELVLTHNKQFGDFSYGLRGNIGWSRNRVLRMNESPNVPDYQRRTGRKLGMKLGLVSEGLFQSTEEIWSSPTFDHIAKSAILPGDVKYKDLNGDGKINYAQDFTFIGNSNIPELMYGMNMSARWRNVDLNIFFQGAAIADFALSGTYSNGVIDNTIFTRPFYGNGNSPYFMIQNSWTPDNPNAEFTRLSTELRGQSSAWTSSWWLRDASYLRLKNAQLGYTINRSALQRIGFDNIRFTLTGTNIFTWSKLNKYNIDPEAPDVNNGYYPQQRTFEFGLMLTF